MFLSKFFEPKPFNEGYLPEVDGHKVYFWELGNPKGKVILSTHGGPGGSTKIKYEKHLDLKKYRIILFDQRGCGKSLPKGELKHNTIKDIVYDMKRLLDFLGIKEKVIYKGNSWASTVGLKFAEDYPEMVSHLVLAMIFLGDEDAKKWIGEDSAYFYPDIMERNKKHVKKGVSLTEDCLNKILSGDVEKQLDAMSYYGTYEDNLGALNPITEVKEIDEKALDYARIYMHYESKDFFLDKNELIKNIKKIENIPTLIVHNRLDMNCPVKGAYDLHKAMPNSKLVVVPSAGHSSKLLHKTIYQGMKELLG